MRKYLSTEDTIGHIVGEYIYYECTKCEVVVYSYPIHWDSCACGNIEAVAMTSTVTIKDKNKYKVFEDR
ncbi:hypothetical protein HX071_07655 [Myroides marinus]|uniref:hypothetical protein n=1 Tax=Myroides marinus TaxID=703342 RepID=UPI002576245B|nr:hypothetical protein [Myroides marinus]MDM1502078.1 hypothetical protein [Myroides marinus]